MSDPTRNINLSSDDLAALRKSHTPTPIPACRVCGCELSIQAIGGGEPTKYACSAADYFHGGEEHYRDSQFVDYRHTDSRVLALLDAYELLTGGPMSGHHIDYTPQGDAPYCRECTDELHDYTLCRVGQLLWSSETLTSNANEAADGS